MTRHPKLREWLDNHSARCWWQVEQEAGGVLRYITLWTVYPRKATVHTSVRQVMTVEWEGEEDRQNWDILIPVSESNSIDITLGEASRYAEAP